MRAQISLQSISTLSNKVVIEISNTLNGEGVNFFVKLFLLISNETNLSTITTTTERRTDRDRRSLISCLTVEITWKIDLADSIYTRMPIGKGFLKKFLCESKEILKIFVDGRGTDFFRLSSTKHHMQCLFL